MKNFFASAFCAALLTTCAAAPVTAQQAPQCAPNDKVVEFLLEKYGEKREMMAIRANGQLLEVFANLETGTYTVLSSTPEGLSCKIDDGEGYIEFTNLPIPKGEMN